MGHSSMFSKMVLSGLFQSVVQLARMFGLVLCVIWITVDGRVFGGSGHGGFGGGNSIPSSIPDAELRRMDSREATTWRIEDGRVNVARRDLELQKTGTTSSLQQATVGTNPGEDAQLRSGSTAATQQPVMGYVMGMPIMGNVVEQHVSDIEARLASHEASVVRRSSTGRGDQHRGEQQSQQPNAGGQHSGGSSSSGLPSCGSHGRDVLTNSSGGQDVNPGDASQTPSNARRDEEKPRTPLEDTRPFCILCLEPFRPGEKIVGDCPCDFVEEHRMHLVCPGDQTAVGPATPAPRVNDIQNNDHGANCFVYSAEGLVFQGRINSRDALEMGSGDTLELEDVSAAGVPRPESTAFGQFIVDKSFNFSGGGEYVDLPRSPMVGELVSVLYQMTLSTVLSTQEIATRGIPTPPAITHHNTPAAPSTEGILPNGSMLRSDGTVMIDPVLTVVYDGIVGHHPEHTVVEQGSPRNRGSSSSGSYWYAAGGANGVGYGHIPDRRMQEAQQVAMSMVNQLAARADGRKGRILIGHYFSQGEDRWTPGIAFFREERGNGGHNDEGANGVHDNGGGNFDINRLEEIGVQDRSSGESVRLIRTDDPERLGLIPPPPSPTASGGLRDENRRRTHDDDDTSSASSFIVSGPGAIGFRQYKQQNSRPRRFCEIPEGRRISICPSLACPVCRHEMPFTGGTEVKTKAPIYGIRWKIVEVDDDNLVRNRRSGDAERKSGSGDARDGDKAGGCVVASDQTEVATAMETDYADVGDTDIRDTTMEEAEEKPVIEKHTKKYRCVAEVVQIPKDVRGTVLMRARPQMKVETVLTSNEKIKSRKTARNPEPAECNQLASLFKSDIIMSAAVPKGKARKTRTFLRKNDDARTAERTQSGQLAADPGYSFATTCHTSCLGEGSFAATGGTSTFGVASTLESSMYSRAPLSTFTGDVSQAVSSNSPPTPGSSLTLPSVTSGFGMVASPYPRGAGMHLPLVGNEHSSVTTLNDIALTGNASGIGARVTSTLRRKSKSSSPRRRGRLNPRHTLEDVEMIGHQSTSQSSINELYYAKESEAVSEDGSPHQDGGSPHHYVSSIDLGLPQDDDPLVVELPEVMGNVSTLVKLISRSEGAALEACFGEPSRRARSGSSASCSGSSASGGNANGDASASNEGSRARTASSDDLEAGRSGIGEDVRRASNNSTNMAEHLGNGAYAAIALSINNYRNITEHRGVEEDDDPFASVEDAFRKMFQRSVIIQFENDTSANNTTDERGAPRSSTSGTTTGARRSSNRSRRGSDASSSNEFTASRRSAPSRPRRAGITLASVGTTSILRGIVDAREDHLRDQQQRQEEGAQTPALHPQPPTSFASARNGFYVTMEARGRRFASRPTRGNSTSSRSDSSRTSNAAGGSSSFDSTSAVNGNCPEEKKVRRNGVAVLVPAASCQFSNLRVIAPEDAPEHMRQMNETIRNPVRTRHPGQPRPLRFWERPPLRRIVSTGGRYLRILIPAPLCNWLPVIVFLVLISLWALCTDVGSHLDSQFHPHYRFPPYHHPGRSHYKLNVLALYGCPL